MPFYYQSQEVMTFDNDNIFPVRYEKRNEFIDSASNLWVIFYRKIRMEIAKKLRRMNEWVTRFNGLSKRHDRDEHGS